MTTIQVNGSLPITNAPSRSASTNNSVAPATSFASEMQAALNEGTKEASDALSSPKKTEADSLLQTLENLLNTITDIVKQVEENQDVLKDGEVSEELYAALQQIYQLLQQMNQGKQDAQGKRAGEWLHEGVSPIQQGIVATEEEPLFISNMDQKVKDILNLLKGKNADVLPRDFTSRLQTVLSQVENMSQPIQNAIIGKHTDAAPLNEAITQSNALPVKETAQTGEGAMPVSDSSIPEEGTVTKAMHHQLQENVPNVKLEGATPTRNANVPLVPARFFANEMETYIVKQIQVNRGTGATETTLRLFPENLGRVDVRITALNGAVTAHFITSQVAGKEAIEQQLNQLRHALMQQGLQVEKIEVSYMATTSSEQSNADLLQQGKGNSQQQQKGEEEQSAEEAEFNLEELLGEGIPEPEEIVS
ncbi:flagellar hook-length control protein FliK [Aneurinibacillus aneurinilyticus]|nr:flagellar hook-length control protein FliK [Aneurinibacillus aneurinilyticus]MED0707431.1 flagellar hook-length control protein FliK [Aneurinibacillus aneurinilyticus]MED0724761.1 flagellar hook-length control protein FliK [Aneurinibacillus aneurinilyticus]MED0733211.1 flagellar hook-length control protein FliK [Aneurinibacillus aneurinilyticus]MED0742812.1 flagellar hook-length control protein FliK [Aneurinibacillus aneurinilyticus]